MCVKVSRFQFYFLSCSASSPQHHGNIPGVQTVAVMTGHSDMASHTYSICSRYVRRWIPDEHIYKAIPKRGLYMRSSNNNNKTLSVVVCFLL